MKAFGVMVAGAVLVAGWSSTRADTVRLASGAVIRGEVVSEDAHEVRVIVSHTVDGAIQTLKIIAQSQVTGIERGSPDVAIEELPAPPKSDGEQAATRAQAGSEALQAGLTRADAATAAGRYEDAERGYRTLAESADRLAAALPMDAASAGARQDLLQLKRDACAHLLVALEGNLERRQTALDSAESVAQERKRTNKQRVTDLEDLREGKPPPRDGVRRLGEATPEAGALTRKRELELAIKQDEQRLGAHTAWVYSEREALVDLETEIALAREALDAAETALKTAQRNARTRR